MVLGNNDMLNSTIREKNIQIFNSAHGVCIDRGKATTNFGMEEILRKRKDIYRLFAGISSCTTGTGLISLAADPIAL